MRSLTLSDFIDKEFFERGEKINFKDKKNIICYNPKKFFFYEENYEFQSQNKICTIN